MTPNKHKYGCIRMRQKLLLTDFRYTSTRGFGNKSSKVKKVLRKCEETKRKFMNSETVVLSSSVVNDYSIEIAIMRGKLHQEALNSALFEFNNFLCIGSISEKDDLIRIN